MAHATETLENGMVFWSSGDIHSAILISKMDDTLILEQKNNIINIQLSDLPFFLKQIKQLK